MRPPNWRSAVNIRITLTNIALEVGFFLMVPTFFSLTFSGPGWLKAPMLIFGLLVLGMPGEKFLPILSGAGLALVFVLACSAYFPHIAVARSILLVSVIGYGFCGVVLLGNALANVRGTRATAAS
jgi:hypothetical protein